LIANASIVALIASVLEAGYSGREPPPARRPAGQRSYRFSGYYLATPNKNAALNRRVTTAHNRRYGKTRLRFGKVRR
jgi:hypothetical protein